MSYWQEQQDATLSGRVNYNYTAGLPYGNIPVSVFTSGFPDGSTDYANVPAYAPPVKNYPTYRADLHNYDPSRPNDSTPSSDRGLHVLSGHEMARHLAPYIPNLPWVDWNMLTPILYGRKQGLGSEMPVGHERVMDIAAHQKNSGLAQGMLVDPPAPEVVAQGQHQVVPKVRTWW